MKIAVLLGKAAYAETEDFQVLKSGLSEQGHSLEIVSEGGKFAEGTELLLSVGGDGTYLRSVRLAAPAGVPVMGVNFGRLGFLSEFTVPAALKALACGDYITKQRMLLEAGVGESKFLALNEIVVHRIGAAMLGVEVTVSGRKLPTYWGDGLVVASSSGSTAYNMSVGGPIVLPSSKVFIISPIAPHNLNVRPLVVPSDCSISMKFVSREDKVGFSADNQSLQLDKGATVDVHLAQFSLKRLCSDESNFIQALSDKLYWGEDKRNER